jgi:hypothetical protein
MFTRLLHHLTAFQNSTTNGEEDERVFIAAVVVVVVVVVVADAVLHSRKYRNDTCIAQS